MELKEKLLTDMTEFRVGNEKPYLFPMGLSQSGNYHLYNRTTLCIQLGFVDAEKTLSHLKEPNLPIIHTDQSCLYGLARWQKMLIRDEGSPYAIPSVKQQVNCYDNAVIENFFSTLKYIKVRMFLFSRV